MCNDCFQWFDKLSEISGGLSIVVDLSDITITVSDSIFHNNQAESGANMMVSVYGPSHYLPQHVYLSILNSSFINGTALEYGGGLYVASVYRSALPDYAYVVCGITGSIFSGNSAGRFGGGLYALGYSYYEPSSAVTNISNTTFSMNRAKKDGGGACIEGVSTVLISSSVFSQNVAREGGGIHVFTEEKISIYNCLIER